MDPILHALVVDDEADILKENGFSVTTASNSDEAYEALNNKLPTVIILDIWLGDNSLDGLSILEEVKKRYPLMPVIVMSGHGTIDIAVYAIKLGAYDYLEKPFTQDKLLITLKRAREAFKLKRENLDLRSKVIDKTELVGSSPVIVKLKADIEKVAPTSGRIMIHGEVGTGKELAARLIHKKSNRLQGHFIIFNPSGMSLDKVMSELFGECEKIDPKAQGLTKRLSMLEAANKGTIYIDEVGDLPIIAQKRLLKFLQDQVLEKPSLNKTLKLDVRIITSTTRDLQQEIAQNKFRQDLYYRLNVIPIKIPKLSERKEDIPILVNYFVKQIAKFSGLKEREFAYETIAALQTYAWPGNIRQLRNVIEWVLIMNPVNNSSNHIDTTNTNSASNNNIANSSYITNSTNIESDHSANYYSAATNGSAHSSIYPNINSSSNGNTNNSAGGSNGSNNNANGANGTNDSASGADIYPNSNSNMKNNASASNGNNSTSGNSIRGNSINNGSGSIGNGINRHSSIRGNGISNGSYNSSTSNYSNNASVSNNLIKPTMLPPEILNNNAIITKPETNLDMISMTLREAREEFEKQYLSLQIRRFNYNISQTSNFVGMERSALHRKLKMLDIHNPMTSSSTPVPKVYTEEG